MADDLSDFDPGYGADTAGELVTGDPSLVGSGGRGSLAKGGRRLWYEQPTFAATPGGGGPSIQTDVGQQNVAGPGDTTDTEQTKPAEPSNVKWWLLGSAGVVAVVAVGALMMRKPKRRNPRRHAGGYYVISKKTGKAVDGPFSVAEADRVLEAGIARGKWSHRTHQVIGGRYMTEQAFSNPQHPTLTPAQSRKRIAELRAQGCTVRKVQTARGTVVFKKCPNPIARGYSQKTIGANIAKLRREGYGPKKAAAIAYGAARKSWRSRHARGAYPAHLRATR